MNYSCVLPLNKNIVDQQENVHAHRVRAGKRTYFLDLKRSRNGDCYIVMTESRKNRDEENISFTKTKLFLYPEDVNRFMSALGETVAKMKSLMPNYNFDQISDRE